MECNKGGEPLRLHRPSWDSRLVTSAARRKSGQILLSMLIDSA